MPFELFVGKYSRLTHPYITISDGKSFNLYFNAAAYEVMGCPTRLLLYYDAANRRIGLKPIGLSDDNAQFTYSVVKNKTRNHFVIGARAFIRHYNLGSHKQLALYSEEGWFVADLPKGGEQ